MKKFILLLSVVFVLMGLIACSDDDNDNGGSSISGVDLSDDDFFEKLDTYMFVDGIDSEFRITLASNNEVVSSELTINGSEIDIANSWIDISAYDEGLNYIVMIGDSMLPSGLVIAPGTELDIHLEINGASYNDVMTVASTPNVAEQELDPSSDFTVTWTLENDADAQVVSLMCESYIFDDTDDFDEDVQVNGAARSYKFSKNLYSDFIAGSMFTYDYGVDTMNYKVSGKHILVMGSSDSIEGDSFSGKEANVTRKFNLIKTILK